MGKSNTIKTEDFLKMLKGPESEEEAIELIKNNDSSKASIEQYASVAAVVHILINKGLCTADEYKAIKEGYKEVYYKETAKELFKMYQKANEEDKYE